MLNGAATFFDSASGFGRWLALYAATATELMVGFCKVGSGRPSMTWPESVDEALCHGWIDGVRKRIDDESYLIRFTPRRPGSIWSAVNLAQYQSLLAQGRIQPAGAAALARRIAEKSGVYACEQARAAVLSPAEARQFQRCGAQAGVALPCRCCSGGHAGPQAGCLRWLP